MKCETVKRKADLMDCPGAWYGWQPKSGDFSGWGQLVLAGFVEHDEGCGLGHPFSYLLTDSGRAYLNERYSPYDYPFFCWVCRNSFGTQQTLTEHQNRKHARFLHLVP